MRHDRTSSLGWAKNKVNVDYEKQVLRGLETSDG